MPEHAHSTSVSSIASSEPVSPISEKRTHGVETELITLTRHVLAEQRKHRDATGDFTLLLVSIQLGCKYFASAVRRAGLAKLTGLAGSSNVQGEDQQKLDVIANHIFINSLRSSGKVKVMVSEEDDNIIVVEDKRLQGNYSVVFDPLDGSSNIECGVSIGTIFGIYKTTPGAEAGTAADVLRPGKEMVAAGYCMYGSSTNFVLATSQGVNGYTLDTELMVEQTIGEFILTHPKMKIPERGKIYSVNEGNASNWDPVCTKYFHSLKFPTEEGKKPYSLRYIGSMVADVHRTLLYGGVFSYPSDKKSPNGKLRLLYECFPMAFVIEKAGGLATDGRQRILDVVPKGIHDRHPIFLGSKLDMEEIEALYAADDAANKKS